MKKRPLHEFIMSLTKSDIQYVAAMLGERLPVSWNKERAALTLASIYEREPVALLPMLSMTAYSIIADVSKKKAAGVYSIPMHDDNNMAEGIADGIDELIYLGLVDRWYGRYEFPGFIRKINEACTDQIKDRMIQWQEMEDCAYGILLAYGMLETSRFYSMFSQCYPELNVDASAFLKRRVGVWMRCTHFLLPNDNEWVFLQPMEDPDGWYHTINSRKEISHRIYSRDQYIAFARTGFPQIPSCFEDMVVILATKGMDEKLARRMLRNDAFRHRTMLHMKDIIPEFIALTTWNDTRDLNSFMQLYMEFMNCVPTWYNKGNSPKDIVELANGFRRKSPQGDGKWQASSKTAAGGNVLQFPDGGSRAGRNDPCPCGSGRKYKHCCGKNIN